MARAWTNVFHFQHPDDRLTATGSNHFERNAQESIGLSVALVGIMLARPLRMLTQLIHAFCLECSTCSGNPGSDSFIPAHVVFGPFCDQSTLITRGCLDGELLSFWFDQVQ